MISDLRQAYHEHLRVATKRIAELENTIDQLLNGQLSRMYITLLSKFLSLKDALINILAILRHSGQRVPKLCLNLYLLDLNLAKTF